MLHSLTHFSLSLHTLSLSLSLSRSLSLSLALSRSANQVKRDAEQALMRASVMGALFAEHKKKQSGVVDPEVIAVHRVESRIVTPPAPDFNADLLTIAEVRHFQCPISPSITSERVRYNNTDTSNAQLYQKPLLNECDSTTQTLPMPNYTRNRF